jgi:hypothetical protein
MEFLKTDEFKKCTENCASCTFFCAKGGPRSPVKSATLVFFEEFNGASRGRRQNRLKAEC